MNTTIRWTSTASEKEKLTKGKVNKPFRPKERAKVNLDPQQERAKITTPKEMGEQQKEKAPSFVKLAKLLPITPPIAGTKRNKAKAYEVLGVKATMNKSICKNKNLNKKYL